MSEWCVPNFLEQRYPNWDHVHLGVHLPIWRGMSKVSNRREKISLYIIYFELFTHISVNNIFKNHDMLIGKYIFVIFVSLFFIRGFRGTRSSIEMLKVYMVRKSLRTLVLEHSKYWERCILCLFQCLLVVFLVTICNAVKKSQIWWNFFLCIKNQFAIKGLCH